MMNKYEKMARRVIAKVLEDDTIKTVGGIAVVVGLGLLAKKYNVPINVGLNGGRPVVHVTNGCDFSTGSKSSEYIFPMAKNSKEVAISSILETTKSMSFDSSRISAAEKIYDIVENCDYCTELDDLKSYAISALNRISSGCTFSSSKTRITDLIVDITEL